MKKDIKITVVGDGSVGKTCFLICYMTKKRCTLEYVPTVFDNYDEDYILDGSEYKISLWDTAGQEGYDRLRVLSYPNTDCFILCFAINGWASLMNIQEKWVPELKRHRPLTPIVLLATKCDLRNVDDPNLRLVSTEKGLELARDIKAAEYFECSAHDMIGVEQAIESAVRASLKPLPTSKRRTCLIL